MCSYRGKQMNLSRLIIKNNNKKTAVLNFSGIFNLRNQSLQRWISEERTDEAIKGAR